MKKVFATFAFVGLFTSAINAQQATAASTDAAKPQMSKEEKAKQKQKNDEDMAAAFKEAGLTEEQIKQVKDANVEATKKGNEVKKDATLTEEAKAEKLKEINKEKNDKVKAIMGEEKSKLFNAIRKKQKAAAEVKQ